MLNKKLNRKGVQLLSPLNRCEITELENEKVYNLDSCDYNGNSIFRIAIYADYIPSHIFTTEK